MNPNTNDPEARIAELDAILSQARTAWLEAPNMAAKRKARKQIDEALDLRFGLMQIRDSQPPTNS